MIRLENLYRNVKCLLLRVCKLESSVEDIIENCCNDNESNIIVENEILETNTENAISGFSVVDYFFEKELVEENISTTTTNHYISKTNGSLVSNSGFLTTDFIPVTEGDIIRRTSQSYDVALSATTPIAFYNSSQVFISSYLGFVEEIQEFIIPPGVSFVRVSGSVTAGLSVSKLVEGTNYTSNIKNEYLQSVPNGELCNENLCISYKTVGPAADQPYFESSDGYHVFKPIPENTAERFYLMPNGTAPTVQTKLELFTTDYENTAGGNYSGLNILAYINELHIGSNRGGSQQHHKQIFGGKYNSSSLITTSARTEYQLDDTVNFFGNKHTIENILRLTPRSQPSTAIAGDVYYDSTTNKLRCFNGTIWNDLF